MIICGTARENHALLMALGKEAQDYGRAYGELPRCTIFGRRVAFMNVLDDGTDKQINRIWRLLDSEGKGLIEPLPCKIGDRVWAIRSYNGSKHPQEGIVSEMYFLPDMTLQIVVKHVARGIFGKTIFHTLHETQEAIDRLEAEKA